MKPPNLLPKHHVVFMWEPGDRPRAYIDCPYTADDPARPCICYEDWPETNEEIKGCGWQEWLDAAGDDNVTPTETITVKVPVDCVWNDDNGPMFGAVNP